MPYTAGLAADLLPDRYGVIFVPHRHTRRFVRPIKETGKRPRPDRMGLGLFFCKACRKIMPPGGAGIEIGSSRRRCGVWWYNKKQASSEKIPGTLLYNWQAVLCTTSQSASQTRPGCGSQRLLRCRLHPAGRGPNSDSLFPPLAAVVAVAPSRGASGEEAKLHEMPRPPLGRGGGIAQR